MCSDGLIRRKIIEITEITESDDIKGVNVYPNPATNILNIELSFPSETKNKITLCDLMGNNIRTIDEGYYSNKHLESNVFDLSNGIYLLKIELPNKTIIKKIAVVK